MVKTARLAAVSALVPGSDVVVDVGSDHALLGIELIKQNKARTVINIERAQGPLQAGVNNVKKAGLTDRFAHFLSDGFVDYKGPSQVDTIVLAGFGGQNMVGVLTNAKVDWKQVVAQPSNNAAALRRFTLANHYCIDEESIVFDGRFYELMRIVKRPGPSMNDAELMFGPINLQRKEAPFLACWQQRLDHLQKRNELANQPRLASQISLIKKMLEHSHN